MKTKNNYKNIEEVPVWQLAHGLTLKTYRLTESLPKSELYGLISQLRRASSSIPANITEGFYRNSIKELIQFLYTAGGSCGETLYHLLLVKDLGYINNSIYEDLKRDYEMVGRQLNGWIKSLREKEN